MNKNQFSFNSVLLIDDSEIDILVNRRLMELTRFSKNVMVAGSAEEALHFLRHECRSEKDAPDWIFLDMNLPGKSGYDFLEEFAALPAGIFSATRIIILSVFQKPELLQQALEYPYVFRQMDKPLTQAALNELALIAEKKISVSS